MKSISKLTGLLPAAVLGLILAGSATSSRAATAINYTFDSDVQGWYAADGNGTVAWDATHGTSGGGCLKATISAASNTEVDPRIDVPIDSSQYFSVEMDLMIDPASGNGTAGNYGNFQAAMRDASWSWVGLWYGAIDASFNGVYHHIKFILPAPYVSYAHIQLQLGSGTPTSDIIAYIDNVTVTPINPPTPVYLNAFNYADSVTKGVSHWGMPQTLTWDTTHDAGGGPTPAGSMQFVVNYDANNTGWQEGDIQMAPGDWDPSRFTYFDFDLYLDAPTGLSTYGIIQTFIIDNSSAWHWNWIGGPSLNATMIGKWTHFSFPLPAGLTGSHGYVFQVGGGMQQPFTYYIDNVRVWKPATPPSLTKLVRGGPAGLQITMDQNGAQWQRDGITTPVGDTYSWVGYGPVTYAFTITNFPDARAHPGLDAHIYMVNADTIPNLSGNYTYGAVDWNAADLIAVNVQNNGGGGVDFTLKYKTNLPAANPDQTAASIHADTALGTWSIAFNNDTNITLSGPGGVSTNFDLPQDVVDHFNAAMFLHFGIFKDDYNNNGVNDQTSGTFRRIQVVGGASPLDDNFPGPGITGAYAWRPSSASAVSWTPPDTAWWLTWSLPDDGFTVQSAADVRGPWSDAGVTYIVTRGASRSGAVPGASLPSGNSVFFRMLKQ